VGGQKGGWEEKSKGRSVVFTKKKNQHRGLNCTAFLNGGGGKKRKKGTDGSVVSSSNGGLDAGKTVLIGSHGKGRGKRGKVNNKRPTVHINPKITKTLSPKKPTKKVHGGAGRKPRKLKQFTTGQSAAKKKKKVIASQGEGVRLQKRQQGRTAVTGELDRSWDREAGISTYGGNWGGTTGGGEEGAGREILSKLGLSPCVYVHFQSVLAVLTFQKEQKKRRGEARGFGIRGLHGGRVSTQGRLTCGSRRRKISPEGEGNKTMKKTARVCLKVEA